MMYITWADVEEGVRHIFSNLPDLNDFDGIAAPARGGLVPGTMLSHLTNLPLLTFDPKLPTLPVDLYTKRYILIDEICDTGDTLIELTARTRNHLTCALYKRHSSKYEPNVVWRYVEHDDWLVFPWEMTPDA